MPKAHDMPAGAASAGGRSVRVKRAMRFFGWWFCFFAFLGPLSVCPVCGQSGCPGGAVSAGAFGGVLATAVSGVRWLWGLVARRRVGRRERDEDCRGKR